LQVREVHVAFRRRIIQHAATRKKPALGCQAARAGGWAHRHRNFKPTYNETLTDQFEQLPSPLGACFNLAIGKS
jgi:hypothetical protein